MKSVAVRLIAGAVLCGAGAVSLPAEAMPVTDLAAAARQGSNVANVRWVCGPFRCWWQPVIVAPVWHRPVYVVPRPVYVWPRPVVVVRPAWGPRFVGPGWHGGWGGGWGYRRAWHRW
jgi:hypothetical protein